jgi:hypothetical protein
MTPVGMSYDRRAFKRPTDEQAHLMKATVKTAQYAVKTAEGVLGAAQGLESMLNGATVPDKGDLGNIEGLLQHYRKGADLLNRMVATLEGNIKDLKKTIK